MPLNRWKIAQTGTTGFATDPRISIKNYITAQWANVCTDPAITNITVDTKAKAMQKMWSIIIEKLPTKVERRFIGLRKEVKEHYRLIVTAKGFNSIDKAWKMVNALDDLFDATPTALQSVGIDWQHITDTELLLDNTDDVVKKGEATSNQMTIYVVRMVLTYHKYI